jgi:hypothetical protein
MRSLSLKLAAALVGASALGFGTANAAPVSPTGIAIKATNPGIEQVRSRHHFRAYVGPRFRYYGYRRSYPGFGIYINPGIGIYSGYYPSYYYYNGYSYYPRCWWSHRYHRRICRW